MIDPYSTLTQLVTCLLSYLPFLGLCPHPLEDPAVDYQFTTSVFPHRLRYGKHYSCLYLFLSCFLKHMKYFHFSFSHFFQCKQMLPVPPLSPCYQANLFLIFPNSCIAAVYLLLMSQLSQLPRTLRGIHLYWGSRRHIITSASRYQIIRDLFFLKRLGHLLHEMNCFTVSQDDTQLGTSLLLFRSFCKCYLFSTGEHL